MTDQTAAERAETAENALELLHARIHRDLPGDGSELPPPEDEFWARQLDGLVAFADEVYLPFADAAKGAPAEPACKRCHIPFDPADKRHDGHAEEPSMPGYCRSCVDRCHDSEDAFHRCVICDPPKAVP